MLANVLTCALTGGIGVGAGLVVNVLRAKRAKRKVDEASTTNPEDVKRPRQSQQSRQDLLQTYGLMPHLRVIEKYVNFNDKEEMHANISVHKHLKRILELIEQSELDKIKSKYWSPAGAISVQRRQVRLWMGTLNNMFKERMTTIPEELVKAMQFLIDYTKAEQYNQLLK